MLSGRRGSPSLRSCDAMKNVDPSTIRHSRVRLSVPVGVGYSNLNSDANLLSTAWLQKTIVAVERHQICRNAITLYTRTSLRPPLSFCCCLDEARNLRPPYRLCRRFCPRTDQQGEILIGKLYVPGMVPVK